MLLYLTPYDAHILPSLSVRRNLPPTARSPFWRCPRSSEGPNDTRPRTCIGIELVTTWNFDICTCLYKFSDLDVAAQRKNIIQFPTVTIIITLGHFARILLGFPSRRYPPYQRRTFYRLIFDIRRALLRSHRLGCAAWAGGEGAAAVDI